MDKPPKEITVCHLEVVVMPNGEIICDGLSVGWVQRLGKYLTRIPPVPVPTRCPYDEAQCEWPRCLKDDPKCRELNPQVAAALLDPSDR